MTSVLAIIVSALLMRGGAVYVDTPPIPTAHAYPDVQTWLVYTNSLCDSFPYMLRHGNAWVAAVRDAPSYSTTGTIKVLTSTTLTNWTVAATMTPTNGFVDLREAALANDPDGRLQLITRQHNGADIEFRLEENLVAWSSDTGATWTAFQSILDNTNRTCEIHWYNGTNYVVTYTYGVHTNVVLRESADGLAWSQVSQICTDAVGAETDFMFTESGDCVVFLRDYYTKPGRVYTAAYPWTEWSHVVTDRQIHGPAIGTDGTNVWLCSRYIMDQYDPTESGGGSCQSVTGICTVTPTGKMEWLAWLPPADYGPTIVGGYDTGYGCPVYCDGALWVIYYAPARNYADQRSDVYIARIPLSD